MKLQMTPVATTRVETLAAAFLSFPPRESRPVAIQIFIITNRARLMPSRLRFSYISVVRRHPYVYIIYDGIVADRVA